MKRYVILIVVLALLCAVLCGCDVRDGYISENNGTIVDNDTKDKGTNDKGSTNKGKTADPQSTAIPGTQVITP